MAVAVQPPGPRDVVPGWTIVSFYRDPIGSLQRMARTYGDVARFRWGSRYEHLLVHPELVERVLVTEQRAFVKGQALQETKRILGEGLLTSEGDFHLRQRRLVQPLFHRRRIAAYAEEMVACTERALGRWRDGAEVDAHDEMTRLTLAIVARTLLAADVEGEAPEIGRALTDALDSLQRFMLPFPDLVELVPLPSTRRLRASRERLDATIYRLIEERRARPGGGDLLSLLLEARDEDGKAMPDEQVRDEAMTIFLAGHETTANALAWTWLLLARNPEAEGRLHAELDGVLGGRAPEPDDLVRLPELDRILSESLRLYPPAWLIGRRAAREVELGGYVLPPGSIALVSPYVTHRDARFFPEPDRFDPGRWADEVEAARPRFSFFPFGGGVRRCIGESFALMEAKLVLATIAQRWRLRHLGGEVGLLPRITLRPRGPISVRLERRA
jgi:cytochrome P450